MVPQTANETVDCPKCQAVIVVQIGRNANEVVWQHIEAGCPPTTAKIACSLKGCRNDEILRLRCTGCKKLFCVPHRQQLDHQCTALPRQQINNNNNNNSSAAGAADTLTARMRGLMNSYKERFFAKDPEKAKALFRNKAVGDEKIPAERRVYAEIHFPYSSKVEPKNMFFNSAWSSGKALDYIATTGKISNQNDKPGAEKLYLWNLETGEKLGNTVMLRDLPARGLVLLLETEAGVLGHK